MGWDGQAVVELSWGWACPTRVVGWAQSIPGQHMGLEGEEEGPEGLWVRMGETSSSRCGELRQEDRRLFVK